MTNLPSLYAVRKNVTTSGVPLKLSPHIVASTIAFNEVGATGDTITDSGSGLLNAGFVAGDIIQVSGSTSNDGYYTIKTVVAGTITVSDADDLANEIAGSAVTISKVTKNLDGTYTVYSPAIEDGVMVVIKAKETNTGYICIGNSSANALNTSLKHYRLDSSSVLRLYVKYLSAVWMDATVSGEGVEVIFEKA